MSKTIENLKTGNYKVVDNQGVSVTIHFLECLEKEFADLEAKLAEMTKKYELASCPTGGLVDRVRNLEQQLEEYKNKENTSAVNSWDEMLKNCESCGLNECIGCEYTQTCVQNIKQQLAEKDKEIEDCKRNELYEENMKILAVKNQTKLAIQELEKVKELAVRLLDGFCHSINYSKKEFRGHRYVDFYDLIRGIDYQITELGGNQITELGGFEK